MATVSTYVVLGVFVLLLGSTSCPYICDMGQGSAEQGPWKKTQTAEARRVGGGAFHADERRQRGLKLTVKGLPQHIRLEVRKSRRCGHSSHPTSLEAIRACEELLRRATGK